MHSSFIFIAALGVVVASPPLPAAGLAAGRSAAAPLAERPPGPPPEAVEACKDSSEGDACTVEFRGQTLAGTCRKGPNGEQPLACMPARPPEPPR